MKCTELKNLPKGELFKRTPSTSIVYVKSDYDRQAKKYATYKYEDSNTELFLRGETRVYSGFTY